MQDQATPFIIWTFRRSGGTNLGQALFKASDYTSVQHEPFNQDRIFGNVLINWKKNQDLKSLYASIDKILKENILIKHCLELMPHEINNAILELSVKQGYKHLFLYREEAKNRLLSLNYSLKTNVWGKEHLKTRPFNQAVFSEEIQIERLLNHEKLCRSEMLTIFKKLINIGIKPLSVSFEQIYKTDINYSSLLIKGLFQSLIGNTDTVTNDFLNKTLKGGKQGTNEDYLRFPNSEQFIAELKKIDAFKLQQNKKINYSINDNIKIQHCEVWDALPGIKLNEYHLQGVCLAKQPYQISINDQCINLEKGLKSDRVSKKFPKNQQSRSCRFISDAFIYDNTSVVIESKNYTFEEFVDCSSKNAVELLKDALNSESFIVLHPVTKAITFSRISFNNGYSHCILFSDENKYNQWVMIQEMHCLAQGYYYEGNIIFPFEKPKHSKNLLEFIEEKLKTLTYDLNAKKIHGLILSSSRPHHFFFDQYIHLLSDLKSQNFLDKTYIDKHCFFNHIGNIKFKSVNSSGCYLRPLLGSYNSNLPITYAEKLRKTVEPHKIHKKTSNNDITLWFGISGIKRSWLDQINGCVNIVNELSKYFKNIYLIIDGMSAYSDVTRAVEKENIIYNKIKNQLKPNTQVTKVTSLIGRDYRTKINYGSRCDCFIAMDGAGLIAPLVLLNLPGVIHGIGILNNYSSLYLESKLIKYIKSNKISDTSFNKPSVAKSYDIDWIIVFNSLMQVLEKEHKAIPYLSDKNNKDKNNFLILKNDLNEKPADILREVSLWFEKSGDIKTALILMQKALNHKPGAQFIQKKIDQYKLLLGL